MENGRQLSSPSQENPLTYEYLYESNLKEFKKEELVEIARGLIRENDILKSVISQIKSCLYDSDGKTEVFQGNEQEPEELDTVLKDFTNIEKTCVNCSSDVNDEQKLRSFGERKKLSKHSDQGFAQEGERRKEKRNRVLMEYMEKVRGTRNYLAGFCRDLIEPKQDDQKNSLDKDNKIYPGHNKSRSEDHKTNSVNQENLCIFISKNLKFYEENQENKRRLHKMFSVNSKTQILFIENKDQLIKEIYRKNYNEGIKVLIDAEDREDRHNRDAFINIRNENKKSIYNELLDIWIHVVKYLPNAKVLVVGERDRIAEKLGKYFSEVDVFKRTHEIKAESWLWKAPSNEDE